MQSDETNGGRSLKRSKIVHDEENKENSLYFPPSLPTRIRRGVRRKNILFGISIEFISLQLVRSYSEQQSSTNEEQIKASVELGKTIDRMVFIVQLIFCF